MDLSITWNAPKSVVFRAGNALVSKMFDDQMAVSLRAFDVPSIHSQQG